MSKSKLEEWAKKRAIDAHSSHPNDYVERENTQFDIEQGALWLLERAREWCEQNQAFEPVINDRRNAEDLYKHLEQLCGKEGES